MSKETDFWCETHSMREISERLEQLEQKLADAEKQNEWIACSDRLPEQGQFVLGFRDNVDSKIIDADYWDTKYWKMNNYTYWKPITPPQEGKPIIPPLTYGKKLDLLDARKSLGLESETVPQTPVQIPLGKAKHWGDE